MLGAGLQFPSGPPESSTGRVRSAHCYPLLPCRHSFNARRVLLCLPLDWFFLSPRVECCALRHRRLPPPSSPVSALCASYFCDMFGMHGGGGGGGGGGLRAPRNNFLRRVSCGIANIGQGLRRKSQALLLKSGSKCWRVTLWPQVLCYFAL